REVGYGITDSWDEIVETLHGAPVSTGTELGGYMREFETRVRQVTDEIYMRLDDEQRCPERLGYDRQMRVILSVETDCNFRDAEGRSYEIYRDYIVEDSSTGTGDSPTGTGDSFAGTGYRITGTAGTDEEGSSEDDEDDDMDIEADESPAPPSSPIRSLGYQASMIRLRAEAASTSHSPPLPPPFILSPTRSDAPLSGTPLLLPISASTSSPPLQLPPASHREDRPEVTLPPRKRLGIALGPGYEVGESSSAAAAARPAGCLRADYDFVTTMDREIMRDPEREVGYGITDSWDEIVEALQGAPVSTDTELGGYMREFETRVRQDTKEIYIRLDDKQSERQLLVGRLNMLFRDRRAHAYTPHLMETEARMSREAWVRSTDASDLVRGEEIYIDYRVEDSPTGTGDSPTGTGDSFAGTGYRITGTTGTRWREDRPEVTLPPRKRLDIVLGPRYEVGKSSSAAAARPARGFRADYGFVANVDREIMRDLEREVGYWITDSWDEIVETLQGVPDSTDTELGGYVREFESRVRHD
nr:hypothetical protein [Tanacetum cinerariifolium]